MKLFLSIVKRELILSASSKGINYYFVEQGIHPTQIIEYLKEEITSEDFIEIYNKLIIASGEPKLEYISCNASTFLLEDGIAMSVDAFDRYLEYSYGKPYDEEEAQQKELRAIYDFINTL